MSGDPTATTPPPKHVRVGRIGRAYQLAGGLRLRLEPGVPPHALRAAERLFVIGYGLASVRELRLRPAGPVLYLEGVRDRGAARALTGADVHAPEAVLTAVIASPDAEARRTPVGQQVRCGDRLIGRVTDVRPAGGNPLLVVDAGGREVLLPLAAPYVQADGSVVRLIDPPEGLLEP